MEILLRRLFISAIVGGIVGLGCLVFVLVWLAIQLGLGWVFALAGVASLSVFILDSLTHSVTGGTDGTDTDS